MLFIPTRTKNCYCCLALRSHVRPPRTGVNAAFGVRGLGVEEAVIFEIMIRIAGASKRTTYHCASEGPRSIDILSIGQLFEALGQGGVLVRDSQLRRVWREG